MAAHPDDVRLEALPEDKAALPSWLRDSHMATGSEGAEWIAFCARGWAAELSRTR